MQLASLFLSLVACVGPGEDSGAAQDSSQPTDSGDTADSDTDTDTADTDTADTEEPTPQIIAIAAGAAHTCWIIASELTNEVVCVGESSHGQRDVPVSGSWTALTAGGATTCATSPTTTECWGLATDAPPSLISPPAEVEGGLSLARSHGCGLTDAGVACWGDDGSGQASPPTLPLVWQAVASGGQHSCGLNGGELACWGASSQGQSAPPPGQYVRVGLGERYSCAVSSSAALTCWGDNQHGQTQSPPSELFSSVAAGTRHACGLRTDGLVRCWGSNESGQTQAPPQGAFRMLAAGERHSCAVSGDSDVQCWGHAPAWAGPSR